MSTERGYKSIEVQSRRTQPFNPKQVWEDVNEIVEGTLRALSVKNGRDGGKPRRIKKLFLLFLKKSFMPLKRISYINSIKSEWHHLKKIF